MPKISIITITLDSERYLDETIRSVTAQTYPHIEYIIVDGGSTDSTIEIIRSHENHIDSWISEPDDGISDAMNKGLSLATGKFIYFLNSDDYLENENAVAEVVKNLNAKDDVYFFGMFTERDGVKVLREPGRFRRKINFKLGLSHQSSVCSMQLFETIGRFDTSLQVTMDYDLFLRAYRKGLTAKSVDSPIATMRMIGISSQTDWPSLSHRFGEERKVHLKNCNSIGLRLIYEFYWLFYWPYRRVLYLVRGRTNQVPSNTKG